MSTTTTIAIRVSRNANTDDECDPYVHPDILYALCLHARSPLWAHATQKAFVDAFAGHTLTFATTKPHGVAPFRLQSIHGTNSVALRRWLHAHIPPPKRASSTRRSKHTRRQGHQTACTTSKMVVQAKTKKTKTRTKPHDVGVDALLLVPCSCSPPVLSAPSPTDRTFLTTSRAIKTPHELKRMQKACDISCVAIRHMVRRASSYKSTTAMLAGGMKILRKRVGCTAEHDSDTTAYTTILTLNGHGKHLSRQGLERVHPTFEHHTFDHTAHPVVLLDMGARYGGYCADITRTFATTTPTARQRDVYRSVLTLYELGESMVKPGVQYADIDRAVEAQLQVELRRLGYVDYENTKKYMPHSLGHSVGVEVHDTPSITSVGPLRPSMVLTIEPGIYTDDLDIRIENTIVVTATGCRVLSDKVPWDMEWFDKKKQRGLLLGRGGV